MPPVSPRRGADPLARAWGRQFIGVDELDFHKAVNLSTTSEEDHANMGKLLSPIDEEGHGISYNKIIHKNTPLSVHLTIRFNDPEVKSSHSHCYYSSRSFHASDRICRGLVRRIDHGSAEFITRKDPHALNNIQCLRKGPKPWRFEMTFKILVKGHSGPWAERIFISYQKHPLNRTSAEQVLHSAHSIVGLFLQRHDKGFHWKDGPTESYFPDSPEIFSPGPNVIPNLACVPRSLFIASSQDWEFVPGYTLKLIVKTSSPAQAQSGITRTVRIDSAQKSPLHLSLGEDLLWQACSSIQDVLDSRKNALDRSHADCDNSQGRCQHIERSALSLELYVVNNLGPVYDHLHRSIQSDLCLFGESEEEKECDELADTVRHQFKMLRSKTDQQIEKLHDFDFHIAELVGDGWRETDCARFTVNGDLILMRRDVEALLDRIRTGVIDVLKEQDVIIRMVAYKRGHLVLDKALVARERHSGPSDPPHVLINRLKDRVQKDIDMICRDTCILDDIPERAPMFASTPSRPKMASARPFAARSPNSHQTPPGSPASFRTRPPTPPCGPARAASSRSFPLIPIKYKESPDGASISSRSPRPPVVGEEGFPGLKPAAEVFPRMARTVDFDAESTSTHSSMPTLAESDTPSPDHSMLITPNHVRTCLPTPGGLSFEDSGYHSRFSTDGASASSRTSYSEGHQWVETKVDENPRFRAPHSVPVNAPKSEKKVQMQDQLNPSGTEDLSGTNPTACPPPLRSIDIATTDETVCSGPEIEIHSPKDDLPTEAWLQHYSEFVDENYETTKESNPSSDDHAAASESGAAELRTLAAGVEIKETSIGAAVETETLKHDSSGVVHKAEALGCQSDPVESAESTGSGTKELTSEEALFRSKPDFFEHDDEPEDEMVDSETKETCSPTGHSVSSESEQSPMGVSEVSEQSDHVTSDRGSEVVQSCTAETDETKVTVAELTSDSPLVAERALSAEIEAETEYDNVACEKVQLGHEKETTSDPSIDCQDEPCRQTVTESASPAVVGKSTVPDFDLSRDSTAPSAPTRSNENTYLLPVPIPPNRNSWSSSSEWEDYVSDEASRKSCDSVDTIRPSLSLHPSIADDDCPDHQRPDSPKRLRTPTAGLLGLSESRWAEFGIRSALTGTHAFDKGIARPRTAPLLVVKDRAEGLELRDEEADNERPTSPHNNKTAVHRHHPQQHTRHNKSIGSILFLGGGGASRGPREVKRKQSSRDLSKNKDKTKKKSDEKQAAEVTPVAPKQEEHVDEMGRFPRAMMLVAGLAFASSVVSRSGGS